MNPKEKFEQEQNFLETSPDEILDRIKVKISLSKPEDWQVKTIEAWLEREKINDAVGNMVDFFGLDKKESEHLKKLPIEIIKKLFKKEQKIEEKNEEE